MELFFDVETTGLLKFKEPYEHKEQPFILQLGAVLSDENTIYNKISILVTPSDVAFDFVVPEEVVKIHGISKEMVQTGGFTTTAMTEMFSRMLHKADKIVCHNVDFDRKVIQSALHRTDAKTTLDILRVKPAFCTMKESTDLCKLPGKYGKYKWPKLAELYKFLFNEELVGAHDALVDIMATRRCYYEIMKRRQV